jgi:hypothetical protein
MTWPGFKPVLEYDAENDAVRATGHMTSEYSEERGVDVMLMAVIQRDKVTGAITGEATGVGIPDTSSLTIHPTKSNGTCDWEAVLKEDHEDRIEGNDAGDPPPVKTVAKQLVTGTVPGIETIGVAFAKLKREEKKAGEETGEPSDTEWYVWFNPVTLEPARVEPGAITPVTVQPVSVPEPRVTASAEAG